MCMRAGQLAQVPKQVRALNTREVRQAGSAESAPGALCAALAIDAAAAPAAAGPRAHHVRPAHGRPQLLVRLLRRLLAQLGLAASACAAAGGGRRRRPGVGGQASTAVSVEAPLPPRLASSEAAGRAAGAGRVSRWRAGVQMWRARSPRPRVRVVPICSLFMAWWLSSACASVLTAQNSTPCAAGGGGLHVRRAAAGRLAFPPGATPAPAGPWAGLLAPAPVPAAAPRRAAAAPAHREAAGDHAVDGIAAAAAHADDLDARVACGGRGARRGGGGVFSARRRGAAGQRAVRHSCAGSDPAYVLRRDDLKACS